MNETDFFSPVEASTRARLFFISGWTPDSQRVTGEPHRRCHGGASGGPARMGDLPGIDFSRSPSCWRKRTTPHPPHPHVRRRYPEVEKRRLIAEQRVFLLKSGGPRLFESVFWRLERIAFIFIIPFPGSFLLLLALTQIYAYPLYARFSKYSRFFL